MAGRAGAKNHTRVEVLLPAVGLNLLLEVTIFIERADANERDPEVARGLAVIAGEHAEAAGVNAQAFVKAEFGREINKRAALVAGMVLGEPAVVERLHVRLEFAPHGLVHAEEHLVLQQRFPMGRLDVDQQLNRITIHRPQSGLDVREHAARLRIPRPPQVVRQFAQPRNFLGQFNVSH